MKIQVSGFADFLVEDLIEACEFYSRILLHDKISKDILLFLERNVGHHLPAETWTEDLRNRTFTIIIRDHPDDDNIFQSVAHEMVHVQQWATKQLQTMWVSNQENPGWIELWMGRVWKPNENEHPYFDCPWEVNAYGREAGLYHRWKEHKGLI